MPNLDVDIDMREALWTRIADALRSSSGEPRVVRVGVDVEGVDPFGWLRQHDELDRVYWASRDGGECFAGLGRADVVEGDAPVDYPGIRGRLAALLATGEPDVRYFGGIRFDHGTAPAPEWAAFRAFRFVLPRFELHVTPDATRLTCNLVLPRDAEEADALRAQVEALALDVDPVAESLPAALSRADEPDRAGWEQNIAHALAAFDDEKLCKVVLARKAVLGFDGAVDPVVLLRRLLDATPGTFHFLFQPEGEPAFVGASPERLFSRSERRLLSEAVAGTRPRGYDAEDDARLRRELLGSDKDQREHDFVRRSIRRTLSSLCDAVHVDDEAGEMTLRNHVHLVSRAHGTLADGIDEVDVLRGLHPTPAVGGVPKREARETIGMLEPFDRGWYAGPVGWIGPESAEFAVAIRSGLVQGRRLSLFSGAGIVPGSTAQAEWNEIEHKICDFMGVLGLDAEQAVARRA